MAPNVIIASVIACTLCAINVAAARVCTSDDAGKLPDVIILEQGTTQVEAIEAVLQCDMPPLNADIASATEDETKEWLDALRTRAENTQRDLKIAQAKAESAAQKVNELDALVTALPASDPATQQAVVAAYQEAQDAYKGLADSLAQVTYTQSATAGAWNPFAGWPGFTGVEHVVVEITSQPAGADIYINENNVHKTTAMTSIRWNLVSTIRLELSGYKSCQFGEGQYVPAERSPSGQATFSCILAMSSP